MFEILPNPSLESLMLVGRAVLLVGAFGVFAVAFIRWRRTDERNDARLIAHLERTFAEMRSLHETVAVMNARIEAMGERTEIDSRLAPASMAGSQRGYEVAARLAKNGAGAEELVGSCGVTRHEAELLVRLHGANNRPTTRETAASPRTQQRAPEPVSQHAGEHVSWPTTVAAPAPKQNVARKQQRGSLLSVVG